MFPYLSPPFRIGHNVRAQRSGQCSLVTFFVSDPVFSRGFKENIYLNATSSGQPHGPLARPSVSWVR